MNENDKSRSGLQTAVDFAHAARAVKRIMQAAAVSGVHGAAAATAREVFPLLLKVLVAALVIFIAVPMVIFTALPNIFFGYNSSGTDTVIQMTQQAMTLGGVYMTLGNFEGAQIDSVVTGIAAEYEKNGTTIDHIVVTSAMTDDDLLWVIAINSAAHQQDLNTKPEKSNIINYDTITIEHISPQSPSGTSIFTGDDIHKLKNLTLLTPPENDLAANKDYAAKKPIYVNSTYKLNTFFESIDTWNVRASEQWETHLIDMACKIFVV